MWKEEQGYWTREYSFTDFKTALEFVNKVGDVAEEEQHHPDVELGWGRVKLLLRSHSADAITEKDYALAKKIEEINKT